MNRSADHLLALDLGTSYFKAAIVSSSGRVIALARRPTPVLHPAPGLWEMSADAVLSALSELCSELASAAPPHAVIAGVCAASQANTFILLDHEDVPLTPFILWPDSRARDLPLPDLGDTAGLCGIPALDHEFAVAKLPLVLRSLGGRSAARLAFLNDYITRWLTGRWTADASTASLTGLVDVHTNQWRPEALSRCGADDLLLGKLLRPSHVIGPLLPDRVRELQVSPGCKVITGSLDQYATMLGAGAAEPGIVAESTGTVLSALTPAASFQAHLSATFQGPAWPQNHSHSQDILWARIAFSETSASLLEHYRSTFAPQFSFEQLDHLASQSESPAPVHRLDGSANRDAAFGSIAPGTPPGDVVLGIYHRVADELSLLLSQLGVTPTQIRSSGGGARSRLWLSIKAAKLRTPVCLTSCTESTVLGAAILAAAGLGWGDPVSLSRDWVQVVDEIRPHLSPAPVPSPTVT
jgi:xylulokinase